VAQLDEPSGVHHALSVTGGEPLLQAAFVRELARRARARGLRSFLETNATLPAALAELAPDLDIISLDAKLASATGGPSNVTALVECLAVAPTRAYVKAVVCSQTTIEEIGAVAEAVAGVSPEVPLVLQPVTPRGGRQPPSARQLLGLQGAACRHLIQVRVIPQCHGLLGVL
jgi:pyruvate-formate lyase-activating enzyme